MKAKVLKGLNDNDAISEVLANMESKYKFKKPFALTDTVNAGEFQSIIKEGQPIDDFALSSKKSALKERKGHGRHTHRIQWWIIMKAFEDQKANGLRFGKSKPVDAYKYLGTSNTGPAAIRDWGESRYLLSDDGLGRPKRVATATDTFGASAVDRTSFMRHRERNKGANLWYLLFDQLPPSVVPDGNNMWMSPEGFRGGYHPFGMVGWE